MVPVLCSVLCIRNWWSQWARQLCCSGWLFAVARGGFLFSLLWLSAVTQGGPSSSLGWLPMLAGGGYSWSLGALVPRRSGWLFVVPRRGLWLLSHEIQMLCRPGDLLDMTGWPRAPHLRIYGHLLKRREGRGACHS